MDFLASLLWDPGPLRGDCRGSYSPDTPLGLFRSFENEICGEKDQITRITQEAQISFKELGEVLDSCDESLQEVSLSLPLFLTRLSTLKPYESYESLFKKEGVNLERVEERIPGNPDEYQWIEKALGDVRRVHGWKEFQKAISLLNRATESLYGPLPLSDLIHLVRAENPFLHRYKTSALEAWIKGNNCLPTTNGVEIQRALISLLQQVVRVVGRTSQPTPPPPYLLARTAAALVHFGLRLFEVEDPTYQAWVDGLHEGNHLKSEGGEEVELGRREGVGQFVLAADPTKVLLFSQGNPLALPISQILSQHSSPESVVHQLHPQDFLPIQGALSFPPCETFLSHYKREKKGATLTLLFTYLEEALHKKRPLFLPFQDTLVLCEGRVCQLPLGRKSSSRQTSLLAIEEYLYTLAGGRQNYSLFCKLVQKSRLLKGGNVLRRTLFDAVRSKKVLPSEEQQAACMQIQATLQEAKIHRSSKTPEEQEKWWLKVLQKWMEEKGVLSFLPPNVYEIIDHRERG